MSVSSTGGATVAPALSTPVKDHNAFVLQEQRVLEEERLFYLGSRCQDDLCGSIEEYYALEELSRHLKCHENWRKITLQFPDSLVQDSSLVTQLLQREFGHDEKEFWILADTAYSACCVDEVASEHVNADVIIHFGDACLNAIQNLPVVYSFGRPQLDLSKVINQFKNLYEKEEKVCLMANAPYTRWIRLLYDKLKPEYSHLIYSQISKDSLDPNSLIVGYDIEKQNNTFPLFRLDSRVLVSDDNSNESANNSKPIDSGYHLFYISIPPDPHLLFLTTQFQSVKLYDPKNSNIIEGPFPSLMKRYKYMHVARTAGCIGILVNTLSLKNTKEMINSLIELIKINDKKHYLFVVGKPNVAKLANFEPVEVWCILGCGQGGIILDQSNDFYRPIVTPYELTLALRDQVSWPGDWMVDFRQVLSNIADQTAAKSVSNTESEQDIPEFDPVTGKSVYTSRPLRQLRHLRIESASPSQELTQQSSDSQGLIKETVSTSISYLQGRAWSGLGTDFENNEEEFDQTGAEVEEGRSGIASRYYSDILEANRL